MFRKAAVLFAGLLALNSAERAMSADIPKYLTNTSYTSQFAHIATNAPGLVGIIVGMDSGKWAESLRGEANEAGQWAHTGWMWESDSKSSRQAPNRVTELERAAWRNADIQSLLDSYSNSNRNTNSRFKSNSTFGGALILGPPNQVHDPELKIPLSPTAD